ncbi:TetR/AcrR family transcriptional regulator C-terminal domain-containing protein [Kitasatospora cystarginea]|uniref:TetR/AcrR family transcriptional regulator C-terminal domain-containing protein n=1 Tax=Kitasatospora cystarginea TaxID=58350 RepID=A0ABN3E8B1_9ACTN
MTDQPTTSIWLRPERSGRGPAPTFDRDRLAAAGVALADTHGLAAVTMRAVAQSLGSAPASLYRYVTTRDELLELMIDQVNGEMCYDGLGTGRWLGDLLALARQGRGTYLRHPWLLDALASRSPLGPEAVGYLEHALAALADHPATWRTRLEAVSVMNSVVASLSRAEITRQLPGQTAPQWQQAQQEYLADVVASGRHPYLTAALAQAAPAAGPEPADRIFDRIITRVLTGLLGADGV